MSRKDNIPKTFTFEDFERLANREPSFEGKWIYRVTQTFYDPEMKNPYPKFDVDMETNRLFLSFEDARNYLRTHKDESVYCSWITQIPVGLKNCDHAAEWLLDNEGNLVDYTTTYTYGDTIEASFFGRPKNRQRFKKGDLVEVIWKHEIRLAVLTSDVPDVQWCWGVYQRGLKRFRDIPYGLDFSDDSAIVIDGPSYYDHAHVSPLSLLKPHFSIPEDIETEMKTWIERAEQESLKERKELDNQKGISLKHNEDTKTPKLIYDYFGGEIFSLDLYFHHYEGINQPVLIVKSGKGYGASLKFDQPEYADLPPYTDRLTPLELTSLQDSLEEVEQGKTKWWYLLRAWNDDEDNPTISLDSPIPDYTKLLKN